MAECGRKKRFPLNGALVSAICCHPGSSSGLIASARIRLLSTVGTRIWRRSYIYIYIERERKIKIKGRLDDDAATERRTHRAGRNSRRLEGVRTLASSPPRASFEDGISRPDAPQKPFPAAAASPRSHSPRGGKR